MLLGGVIARYAFHHPIIWSDELASTLFLWLAMLGSAIASASRRAHAHDRVCGNALSSETAGARCRRNRRCAYLPAVDPPLGLRIRDGRNRGDDAGHADLGCLARGGPADWLCHHDSDRLCEAVRGRQLAGHRTGAVVPAWFSLAALYLAPAGVRKSRQFEPADLLRRYRRLPGVRRRADRLRLWSGDVRISGPYDADAHRRRGRAHGRRNVASDPAVGSAVCVPGPADRDDGNGAGDGRLSGEPSGSCARRSFLCADRRDVSGFGNLRLQGGRHGGDRAGAVSRNEGPWLETRRTGGAVVGNRRSNRNHPAEPGADHGRLGDRRVDRGAVHRRTAAGARGRRDPVRRGVAAQPAARICRM